MDKYDFSLLFDKIDDGITIIKNNRIIYTNKKMKNILGCSPEDLGINSIIFFATPEERKRIRKIKRSGIVKTYKTYNLEFWIKAKDGKRRFLKNQCHPLEEGDKIVGRLVLTQDLTQIKEKEEDCLFIEDLRKVKFLDYLNELVVLQTLNHEIIWANKKASNSLNQDPEQLVGKHCFELWHQRTSPCSSCPVEKVSKTGEFQADEITSPDGKVWLIRGFPVYDKNKKLAAILELTQEITDIKTIESKLQTSEKELEISERRYKELIEISPLPIIVSDLKGNILLVNKQAVEVYRFENKREMLWRNITELVAEENMEKFKEIIIAVDQTGKAIKAITMMKRKDGTVFPFETSAIVIEDEKSDPIGILIMGYDITERIDNERLKKETYKQLARNIESFSILIDQIRNPLTIILGTVELSPNIIEKDIIIQNAERINKITKLIADRWNETEKISKLLQKNFEEEDIYEKIRI
ncbi:MAG: PAS domain-containing protein [Candidatus Heimdallarchaeaceae archaeon]